MRSARRFLKSRSRIVTYKRVFTLFSSNTVDTPTLSATFPTVGTSLLAGGAWIGTTRDVQYRGLMVNAGNYGVAYFVFKLSDMPGYQSFLPMFSEYKINGIKVQFRPERFGPVGIIGEVGTVTNALYSDVPMPEMYTVVDCDGLSNFDPTTVAWADAKNQLQQHSSFRRCEKGWRRHQRTIKPAWMDEIESTPSAQAVRPRRGWLSTNYPDVQHYGMYVLTDRLNADSKYTYNIQVEITYSVSFKGWE